ncbi:MAG: dienelactone hydrolase family protein [Armatimonadota bacterium]
MEEFADLAWRDGRNAVVISPRWGGRVLSWEHDGAERVTKPFKLEGGLLRVLFGEERYPGAGFITPHQVVSREESADGFLLHLRHYWNTPNWLMRQFGWPGKASLLGIDGLLLDKIITFRADLNCFTLDLTVRNLTEETKYLSPWLHNSFADWATGLFMVEDGARAEYADTDIYWGCHIANGKSLRAVLGNGTDYAVLGAAPDLLAGMYAEPARPAPGAFTQASAELRFDGLDLHPGTQWHATAFLALTQDWEQWAADSPVELFSRIEDAPDAAADLSYLTRALELWALPEERERGLMVLSYLDKPPFSSAERFDAAHAFAGYHRHEHGGGVRAVLFATRDMPNLRAELQGPESVQVALNDGEQQRSFSASLQRGEAAVLSLHRTWRKRSPDNNAEVSVRLLDGGEELVTLTMPPMIVRSPDLAYQVQPFPAYMEERWRSEWEPFSGGTATEFRAWQHRRRQRLHRHIAAQVSGPCPLNPRLVERQSGPTCIREKVLIQTEPGFWVPAYVVTPHGAQGRLPAIIFYHGSGPGKQNFVPDEDPACPRAEPAHEMEYLPYRLAAELNCLVFAPDLRWLGELAETNPAQFLWRHAAAGLDFYALFAWDLVCHVEYLCSRPDVDMLRIGAYGSSGGGGATALAALLDERVGAAIVSSTAVSHPKQVKLPEGFFRRMRNTADQHLPLPDSPLYGADSCTLIAPRPLWIMDGLDDAPPESRDAFHARANAGREIVANAYRLLGAEDKFEATWFPGGHCAGMTHENIAGWFGRWFGL